MAAAKKKTAAKKKEYPMVKGVDGLTADENRSARVFSEKFMREFRLSMVDFKKQKLDPLFDVSIQTPNNASRSINLSSTVRDIARAKVGFIVNNAEGNDNAEVYCVGEVQIVPAVIIEDEYGDGVPLTASEIRRMSFTLDADSDADLIGRAVVSQFYCDFGRLYKNGDFAIGCQRYPLAGWIGRAADDLIDERYGYGQTERTIKVAARIVIPQLQAIVARHKHVESEDRQTYDSTYFKNILLGKLGEPLLAPKKTTAKKKVARRK